MMYGTGEPVLNQQPVSNSGSVTVNPTIESKHQSYDGYEDYSVSDYMNEAAGEIRLAKQSVSKPWLKTIIKWT